MSTGPTPHEDDLAPRPSVADLPRPYVADLLEARDRLDVLLEELDRTARARPARAVLGAGRQRRARRAASTRAVSAGRP